MVSLIKNQILKHLSKFTKNLSTDNFNFSTLKGEGELTDLLLDETVLTDLLELPSWLRLTSASCNRVLFRIPWAKLKSVPINLSLDEVQVEVETCEELRTSSCTQGLSSYAGAAKYSFIHKVIDGMTVTVNTVLVTFRSPAFTSSVELSRVVVESRSPEWRRTELPGTRVKDSAKLHVLLFKELEWQNVRIEARSTLDSSLTPLRLITNRATCRIILKKRIKDSCIMGCRLVVTLDDLLWVLTDLQLKAALHFLDSIAGLIQKATELTRKRKAARKLEEVPEYRAQQAQLSHQARAQMDSSQNQAPRLSKIDVVETSYHFIAHKIDLHICDDNSEGRSGHPGLQKGASLQISLRCLQADLYPYHLAAGDRSYWPMYREADSFHTQWVRTAFNSFSNELQAHALSRMQFSSEEGVTSQSVKNFITNELSSLMSSCVVLRLADVIVYQVATSNAKNFVPKELISADRKRRGQTKGDKERYHLPANSPVLHAEFTYYYYPTDDPFPLPSPSLCVHLDPIQTIFDDLSLLWLHSFAVSLQQSLAQTKSATNDKITSQLASFQIHAVAINPRIILEATDGGVGRDRVRALHLTVSRACLSNVRHGSVMAGQSGLVPELRRSVAAFRVSRLFYQTDFPCAPTDLMLRIDEFDAMCSSLSPSMNSNRPSLSTLEDLRIALCKAITPAANELWCATLDPVSCVTVARGGISVPMLDPLPVTVWIRPQILPTLKVHALAHITSLVSVQINHYQLLFLLRLSERIEALTTQLSEDAARLLGSESDLQVVVGATLPQVDITLLMPTLTPGKGSSGGDGESLVPDSSSIQDDNWQSSSSVVNEFPLLLKQKHSQEHIRFVDPSVTVAEAQAGECARVGNGTVRPVPPPSIPLQPAERRLSIGKLSFTEESVFGDFRRAFKKGVVTIAASLDMEKNVAADDASSTISLHSEASSEELAGGGLDPLYCGIGAVEEAAEVVVEDVQEELTLTSPTSPSDRDSASASLKRHDWVSLCTMKLRSVEAGFQLDGPSSVVKLQVGCVALTECPSIPWDEFQNKFRGRHRGELQIEDSVDRRREVAARLQRVGSNMAQLVAQLESISISLSASTISRMAELFQDEMHPPPLPAQVLIQNLKVQINDDRPGLATGEEAPAQNVVVKRLHILRHVDGTVEIPSQATSTSNKCEGHEEELHRLRDENDQLRRRLNQMDRISEENARLRDYQHQSEKLRGCLSDAQDRVESLLHDKKSLLDSVRSLQCQLSLNDINSKR